MPRLLRMPGISAHAEEVVFLEWCSTVGSTVAAGAAIATVETEKANVDIEAEEEAVLWRTLIEPGDAVAVGAPIAVLVGVGKTCRMKAASWTRWVSRPQAPRLSNTTLLITTTSKNATRHSHRHRPKRMPPIRQQTSGSTRHRPTAESYCITAGTQVGAGQ